MERHVRDRPVTLSSTLCFSYTKDPTASATAKGGKCGRSSLGPWERQWLPPSPRGCNPSCTSCGMPYSSHTVGYPAQPCSPRPIPGQEVGSCRTYTKHPTVFHVLTSELRTKEREQGAGSKRLSTPPVSMSLQVAYAALHKGRKAGPHGLEAWRGSLGQLWRLSSILTAR